MGLFKSNKKRTVAGICEDLTKELEMIETEEGIRMSSLEEEIAERQKKLQAATTEQNNARHAIRNITAMFTAPTESTEVETNEI